MIETDYTAMKQFIHWCLKGEILNYQQLYGLIRNNDKMKKEYNVWNNYDFEEYLKLIHCCIREMITTGELNVQSGWIHINPCVECQHNGEIGASVTDCKQCKEYTEYKQEVDNDDG